MSVHGRALSLLATVLAVLAFATSCLALQVNHAGIVDWHKPLIGAPLLQPTPPRAVDTSAGRRIVVVTKSNLLAVLDEAGAVAWRQELRPDDPALAYYVDGDSVLLLSGPGASTARLFDLSAGHLQWERSLLPATSAVLSSPAHLGVDVAFTPDAILVLSDGRIVTRLARDGAVVWGWEFPGGGSTNLFTSIMVDDRDVYLLSLTSSFASPTISHLVLNLDSIFPITDLSHVQSHVEAPDVAHLARAGGGVRAVWTEAGRIRVAPLKADGAVGETKDFLPGGGRKYVSVENVGLRDDGYFVAHQRDGTADVVRIGDKAAIVEHFEPWHGAGDTVAPVHSAAKSNDVLIFTRGAWSPLLKEYLTQAITIERGRAHQSGYSMPFDAASLGVPLFASPVVDGSGHPQYLLTTAGSTLQLVSPQGVHWTRDESLADLAAVRFVDLGEPETEEVREILAEETFVGRVVRHVAELNDLPSYATRFARRFASSYTSALQTQPLALGRLHRDQFGLQKLLIAVSRAGKVSALDSANGNVVWSRNLAPATVHGQHELEVLDMWVVRGVGAVGNPALAIVAVRNHPSGTTSTVGYHIDAFTGEVDGETDATGVPHGREIMGGRPMAAFITPYENCGSKRRVIAVLDHADTMHLFPGCKKVAAAMAADGLAFHVERQAIGGRTLHGYAATAAESVRVHATELWSRPVAGRVTVTPVEPSPVASYGRPLGNKTTLYKYLNPHALVVAALDGDLARVSVVDSVSGATVYDVEVRGAADLKAVMVENWLVYAWLDKDGLGGWRIGSVELYDDSKETPGVSSFAGHHIKAVSQVFVLHTGVHALGFTTSKFGVTAKELVYVNTQGQLASIPRRLLDPRRPTGKPSAADKEEQLIPYDPFIGPDNKRVVSHRYPVIGLRHLAASPALLESTPLIVAYGTDLFLTRGLTPSGTFDILSDTFNKAQLALTLGVLGAGITVARPAVQRKMLRARWF